MQDTDHYDLSDDADYAASIQQGSKSVMMRGDTSKRSSSSEPDGSEVVYLKDNVTIHPSPYSSDRIRGRFKLIKQGSSLFMTWIPYKAQNSDAKLSEKDRNLYTIRAVPFTEVRSIRRHTPTFGWQYIIIVLSSGLAFPTLYFYNGGVKEFLATVRQHVFLVRSVEDANVFIVNDFENPLQRTLSSLEIPRAVPVASGTPTIVTFDKSPSYGNHERDDVSTHNGSSGSSPSIGRHRHRRKSQDPARDLSIHVLEKFSLVTKFAREATSQLFREGQSNGFDAIGIERKSNSLSSSDVPPKPSIAADKKSDSLSSIDIPQKPSTGADKIPIESPVPKDPVEKILRRKHDPDEEAVTNVGSFELIEFKEFDKITLVWGQPRQPPLGSDEWATFLDSEGRVMDSKALRKRVFYGGVEHNLRREVWPFLLGYYAYDSTYAEREFLKSEKKMEYMTIKQQWQSISFEQAKRFTKFRERRGLIEKDVVRTDRSVPFYEGDDNPNVDILRDILLTYSFYNFDLGYCQGMSDLLSPIFFILDDESEAFWCFVALMDRLGPNFNRDQNGMHSQLFALSKLVELLDNPLHNYFKQNDCLNYFFCFRWVLIQFKREFEYEKTMQLWEVLWTHYLSEHLHLYVCVAILKRYRGKITGEQMDFDTLLKFINELSGHINLDAVLREAEALCVCAGENGAACIPPGTPPSLPIDNENSFLYAQQDEVL